MDILLELVGRGLVENDSVVGLVLDYVAIDVSSQVFDAFSSLVSVSTSIPTAKQIFTSGSQ